MVLKTGTIKLVPFFGHSFFVPDETGSKFLLCHCPPIHFKVIKTTNNTTDDRLTNQYSSFWSREYWFPAPSRTVFYSVYHTSVPEKSIPILMTHLQKTGTGFLVPVFGTGFWCVCHWHQVHFGYCTLFCLISQTMQHNYISYAVTVIVVVSAQPARAGAYGLFHDPVAQRTSIDRSAGILPQCPGVAGRSIYYGVGQGGAFSRGQVGVLAPG